MAARSSISKRPSRPTSPPAKRKGIPLAPLALQILYDMQLAGLSDSTHKSSLRAVRKFAQWLQKSLDLASENDLPRYLLFIKNDQQWEGNSLNVAYSPRRNAARKGYEPGGGRWPQSTAVSAPYVYRVAISNRRNCQM